MSTVLSPSALAGERGLAPFPHFPPAAAAVALLGPRGCRWPLGEPAEAGFAFCGAARTSPGGSRGGCSYCALHARAARAGGAHGGKRA